MEFDRNTVIIIVIVILIIVALFYFMNPSSKPQAGGILTLNQVLAGLEYDDDQTFLNNYAAYAQFVINCRNARRRGSQEAAEFAGLLSQLDARQYQCQIAIYGWQGPYMRLAKNPWRDYP